MSRRDTPNWNEEFERATDYLAEASAAQAWSTPGDADIGKWGEDLVIVAQFGDWWAVNGDLVWSDKYKNSEGGWEDIDIPKTHVKVPGGGRVPTTEEEVSIEHVIDRVVINLGIKPGTNLAKKMMHAANNYFGGMSDVAYTSVSGDTMYYANKKRSAENPHSGRRGKNPPPKAWRTMSEFARQYVETALWSSTDESTESGGEPMDKNYTADDIAPATLKRMIADAQKFERENAQDIEAGGGDFEQAAHDFWLTRNGHGTGFWDGDWPEPQATRLTKAAKAFGEYSLYIGDDGKVHGQ